MKKIADDKKYKKRIIDKKIEDYLKVSPAICIEGPKWCGKTWTSSMHANSEFLVGLADNDFQNRQLAQISPTTILEGAIPRLVDEWQEVPHLWDAVRSFSDARGEKGQFILTGSATPNRKGVLHSGAGRIAKIRLRTMSLFESGDSSGAVSLSDLCNGKMSNINTGEVSLLQLAKLIVRGGWPGNIDTPDNLLSYMPQSYINSIMENDFVDGIKYDRHKMRILLKSIARNESTLVSKKTLKDDVEKKEGANINIETVSVYLDVFERMFLLDNQEPFSPGCRSSLRVRQADKIHLSDPSLNCALLNLLPESLVGDLNTFGFLFEALVERDLRIYADSISANLFHYKDYRDNEIDAVVEMQDGRWFAFEIKLGFSQVDAAARNLLRIKSLIEQSGGRAPSGLFVIVGLSNAAYMREDGVYVLPITALRD